MSSITRNREEELSYLRHILKKKGYCLEKEIVKSTTSCKEKKEGAQIEFR